MLGRIANASKNLGCIHAEQGEYTKSIQLLESALRIEQYLGREDIGMVNTLTNLGVAYFLSGQREKAKSFYRTALLLVDEQYRSECRIEIGDLFYNVAIAKPPTQIHLARKYLRRCVNIFTSCLGDSHPKTLQAKAFIKNLARKQKPCDQSMIASDRMQH